MRSSIGRVRGSSWILAFIVGAIVVVTAVRSLPPGVLGLRHDWLTLFDDASYIRTAAELHHAWIPVGTGTPIALPTIWLYAEALSALASLHLSPGFITHFEIVCTLALAFAAFLAFAKFVLKTAALGAVAGALAYAGGPVFFNKVVAGHIPYALGYSLFPLALALLSLALAHPGRRRWAAVAGATLCAEICTNGSQFIFVLPVALVTYACLSRQRKAAFGMVAVMIAGIALFQADSVFTALFSSNQLSGAAAGFPTSWIDANSVGFPQALFLAGYGPAYWESALSAAPLVSRLMPYALCILFFLVVCGLGSGKAKLVRTLALVFIGGVIMLAGIRHSVVAIPVRWLFQHLEAALVFKELYNAAVIPALAFCALVTLGADELSRARARVSVTALLLVAVLLLLTLDAQAAVILLSALFLTVVASLVRPQIMRRTALLLGIIAIAVYTYPSIGSGTFGGQIQGMQVPDADLSAAQQLARAPGWHRTFFLPAPEPVTFIGKAFGGNEPFTHGPGYVANESYPQNIVAASLSSVLHGSTTPAAALFRTMGVRYLAQRRDMASLFLHFEPMTAELSGPFEHVAVRDIAEGTDFISRTKRGTSTIDFGTTGYVTAWAGWAPMPTSLAESAQLLVQQPNLLLLEATHNRLPASRPAAVANAVIVEDDADSVPLIDKDLQLDPSVGWTAANARWFDSPYLAGLPGVYTRSAATITRPLVVRGRAVRKVWIATLASPLGGAIAIAVDGHATAVIPTNADLTSLQWNAIAIAELGPGVHRIDLHTLYGSAESDAVAAIRLREPRAYHAPVIDTRGADASILLGRPLTPAVPVDLNAWTYQPLEAGKQPSHAISALHIQSRNEWFLLHHVLTAAPGDYKLSVQHEQHSGTPLKITVWSSAIGGSIAERLLTGNATSQLPVHIARGSGILQMFVYGDSRKQSLTASVSRITLTRVQPRTLPHYRDIVTPNVSLQCGDYPSTEFSCGVSTPASTILVDLKETYNPNWSLCVKHVGDTGCRTIDATHHFIGNAYDNAWEVHASGNLQFLFSYLPDKAYAALYVVQIFSFWMTVVAAILATALAFRNARYTVAS